MLSTVIFTLLALPGLVLVWSALSLQTNKAKAKTTGLPMLVRWIAPTNPLWMLFGSTIVLKCRALNIGTEYFYRFYPFGWEANERHIVHQELGPAFMLVSPGGNWLCVSDASVFKEILQRRTDFRRNMEQFAVLNVYGKNLSTTDDDEWQKHRKVTAITFTEKNNELVWKSSLLQAREMLEYWLKKESVNTTSDDTKVFTLNVLAAAIFNKVYPFEGVGGESHNRPQDDSFKYRDSLGKILTNIIPIFILGEQGLKARWTPNSWKSAGEAIATFRSYVTKLINEERDHIDNGNQSEKNQHLVAALVRACRDEQRDNSQKTKGMRDMTLSEQEIISNLFVFAFAGNDTTAISLHHLLVDLAAFPETQKWIAEEIKHYLPEDDPSQWHMPRSRSLSGMESIRLNHPLGQLAKQTGDLPQTLTIENRSVVIPPKTAIHLSLPAMHTHPQYWGEESLKWNPARFISTAAGSEPRIENEVLASDTQDHFLPWATGQRVCPGKRFSQAELVATLVVLFRDYTVKPVQNEGESIEQARKRIFETGLEIEHEGSILHEIRYPKKIILKWSTRKD